MFCHFRGITAAPSMSNCWPSPQILWYVPNLVGYARAGLLAAALRIGTVEPVTCCYLCLANILLDGIDGALARALNQASQPATGRHGLTCRARVICLWRRSQPEASCSHAR